MEHTNRILLSDIILQDNSTSSDVPSCTYQGIRYVMLNAAARLLHIDVQWNEDHTVCELTRIPSVGGFSDVHEDDYFAQPVLWAVKKNITSGVSDATFSPDQTCTVAQVLTFLWRANGSPRPAGTVSLPGVNDTGVYYYKPAVWAVKNGLTESFSPDAPCTRSMVMSYLWKLSGRPSAGTSRFTDVPADSDYAQAVAWAVQRGITDGTSKTTFSPDATCTWGQIVTFLHSTFAK